MQNQNKLFKDVSINRLINRSAFLIWFLLLISVSGLAQPGKLMQYDERPIQKEIKETSEKIINNARDAQLYLTRALLYASLTRHVDLKTKNGRTIATTSAEEFYDRAFDDLTKAFEISQTNSYYQEDSAKSIINIYFRRARIAEANGDYDLAVNELNAATNYTNARNINPQHILFERARIFALKKDYAKALTDYNDSFKYGFTKCNECLEKRSALYEQIGDLEKALADYQQIKYTSPPGKIREVAFRLATDYWQKNDFERVIGKLTAVLEDTDLRPEGQALNKKVFLMRANAYRKLKQEAAAVEDERRAAEIKIVLPTRF